MHTLIPHTCPDYLFESVRQKVQELDLDDRDMKADQFMTMDRDDKIFAFARIRQYLGFSEVCSLGVIPEARQHGLGSRLMKALCESSKQPLYLVCIIPSFFEALGFSICNDYPEEIRQKLVYCTQSLSVPEKYVVMRRN